MNRRSLILGAAPALAMTPASAACIFPSRPLPQERIDAAMADIRRALAELYPDHYISAKCSYATASAVW